MMEGTQFKHKSRLSRRRHHLILERAQPWKRTKTADKMLVEAQANDREGGLLDDLIWSI